MPNYVTNDIRLSGPSNQIEKVLKYISTDKDEVDFNTIIPMPESLNVTSGSIEYQAIAVYKYKKLHEDKELKDLFASYGSKAKTLDEFADYLLKQKPGLIEAGEVYVNNIELYGYSTWYGWCNANWGTKWNAIDSWACVDAFGFQTAWGSVDNLILTLSKRFADVTFVYSYADEDFGSNLGKITIKDGEILDSYYPKEQTDDAYDLAAEILGYDDREDWDEEE